jgi:hypothetical protein
VDKLTELAELFRVRDNPNAYNPLIGTHIGGGKIRVRRNVVLSNYKTTVSDIPLMDNGVQFVVLPLGREFLVVGRLI